MGKVLKSLSCVQDFALVLHILVTAGNSTCWADVQEQRVPNITPLTWQHWRVHQFWTSPCKTQHKESAAQQGTCECMKLSYTNAEYWPYLYGSAVFQHFLALLLTPFSGRSRVWICRPIWCSLTGPQPFRLRLTVTPGCYWLVTQDQRVSQAATSPWICKTATPTGKLLVERSRMLVHFQPAPTAAYLRETISMH